MKIEIISDFIGRINNIVIKDKRIFYSIEYILSKIENKGYIYCNSYFLWIFIKKYKKIINLVNKFT